MYIYVYMCMHAWINVLIDSLIVYKLIRLYMYWLDIWIHRYVYACMYVRACMYVNLCIYVCVDWYIDRLIAVWKIDVSTTIQQRLCFILRRYSEKHRATVCILIYIHVVLTRSGCCSRYNKFLFQMYWWTYVRIDWWIDWWIDWCIDWLVYVCMYACKYMYAFMYGWIDRLMDWSFENRSSYDSSTTILLHFAQWFRNASSSWLCLEIDTVITRSRFCSRSNELFFHDVLLDLCMY